MASDGARWEQEHGATNQLQIRKSSGLMLPGGALMGANTMIPTPMASRTAMPLSTPINAAATSLVTPSNVATTHWRTETCPNAPKKRTPGHNANSDMTPTTPATPATSWPTPRNKRTQARFFMSNDSVRSYHSNHGDTEETPCQESDLAAALGSQRVDLMAVAQDLESNTHPILPKNDMQCGSPKMRRHAHVIPRTPERQTNTLAPPTPGPLTEELSVPRTPLPYANLLEFETSLGPLTPDPLMPDPLTPGPLTPICVTEGIGIPRTPRTPVRHAPLLEFQSSLGPTASVSLTDANMLQVQPPRDSPNHVAQEPGVFWTPVRHANILAFQLSQGPMTPSPVTPDEKLRNSAGNALGDHMGLKGLPSAISSTP